MKRRSQPHARPRLLMEPLEPRALLSAAVAVDFPVGPIACSTAAPAASNATPLLGISPDHPAGYSMVDPLAPPGVALSVADLEKIIGQAIARARQLGRNAFIAVTDREGNILAAARMTEAGLTAAADNVDITGGGAGGLEVINGNAGDAAVASSALAAVSKAGTAAFLSSAGNAFSTRTAGYIIQDHFAPGVSNQPSGPLFGVQFSSLPTSDVNRLPLGLSADPGGLPLYRDGRVVGGIGVELDGVYTIDPTRVGGKPTDEELIALAGEVGFAPPNKIRADRVLLGGLRLDFANAKPPKLVSLGTPPEINTLAGAGAVSILIAPHVSPASKFTLTTLSAGGRNIAGEIPNNADLDFFNDTTTQPAFPDGAVNAGEQLTAGEVRQILVQALARNGRLRSAIRKDSPQLSHVSVAVTDLDGNVLGVFRNQDAPVFGYDVAVQKARSAAFLSRPDAAAALTALGADALGVSFGGYAARAAAAGIALDGSVALSGRAIGFLSRPHLPDGIPSAPPGPLTAAAPEASSVFSTGLQTDLLLNRVVGFLDAYQGVRDTQGEAAALAAFADASLPGGFVGGGVVAGSGAPLPGRSLRNGLMIFSGSVPLYKNGVLIGAIGVSGDGTEQDDAVAFAGAKGFQQLGDVKRADQVKVIGHVRLPYVKLPRAPVTL